jgi:hypothetical protein
MVAAVDSTEVAEEHERRGAVAPERTELDGVASFVEHGELREIVGAVQHAPDGSAGLCRAASGALGCADGE